MPEDGGIFNLNQASEMKPGVRTGPGFEVLICPACRSAFRLETGLGSTRFRCACGTEFDAPASACGDSRPSPSGPSGSETLMVFKAGPAAGPPAGAVDPDLAPTVEYRSPGPAMAAPDPAASEGASRPAGAGPLRIGKYEIIGEIARGGMGVVYRARQAGLKREVALKMLLAGQGAGEDQIKRFIREASSAAKLSHPNIVPIYDVGEDQGRHYYAMEFIKGESVAQVVRRMTVVPPRQALKIARDTALALQYAHDMGVVHRDIKPANIMLAPVRDQTRVLAQKSTDSILFSSGASSNFRVMVTDFGLAKDMDSKSMLTVSGTALGTPVYMPPEQADGDLKNVGPRSDIYSLGAVLYEMVTGQEPFTGASIGQVLAKVLSQEPVAPRRIVPSLHKDVETMILTAMAKDRGRRYESMQAMADDMERYLKGESIRARPAGVLYLAWRKARKNPALSALAALFIASAAAFGIWAFLRPGFVTVGVVPPRARVFIDGRPVADPARPVRLMAGLHSVSAEADGLEPARMDVAVARGETREIKLVLAGWLALDLAPRNASLSVDGRPAAADASGVVEISPGPRALRFEAEGYEPRDMEIIAEAGRTREVRLALERQKGLLHVLADPEGALVEIDGVDYGTPLRNHALETGACSARVKKKGYYARDFSALMSRGGTVTRSISLNKAVAWTCTIPDFQRVEPLDDVDRDGMRDLPHLGYLTKIDYISGRTGDVLFDFHVSENVLGAYRWLDADGDGIREFVCPHIDADKKSVVGCFSFKFDRTKPAPQPPTPLWKASGRVERFGSCFVPFRSRDGKGWDVVAGGSPGNLVRISCADGSVLWNADFEGNVLDGCRIPDADGDGEDDLALDVAGIGMCGASSRDGKGIWRVPWAFPEKRDYWAAPWARHLYLEENVHCSCSRRVLLARKERGAEAYDWKGARLFAVPETAIHFFLDSAGSPVLYAEEGPRIRKLNPETGAEIWSASASSAQTDWGAHADLNRDGVLDYIWHEAPRGVIAARNCLDGSMLWEIRCDAGCKAFCDSATVSLGAVILASGPEVRLLDAASGALRWSARLGSPVTYAMAADTFGDGRLEVYASTGKGELAALDFAAGSPLRSALAPNSLQYFQPCDLDRDGVLDVLGFQSTGPSLIKGPKIIWAAKFPTPIRADASPLDADSDGRPDVVVPRGIAAGRAGVTCLKGSDGSVMWATEKGEMIRAAGVADVDGDGKPEILAYGNGVRAIVALRASDGSQAALAAVSDDGYTTPAVADLDRVGGPDAVVGSWFDDRGFHAHDMKTGRRIWHFPLDSCIFAGPVIRDLDGDGAEEVVGAGTNGSVVCIDGASGREKWNVLLPGGIRHPPCVGDVTGDGKPDLSFSSADGWVYVLDCAGAVQARFETGRTGTQPTPAAADADRDGVADLVVGGRGSYHCIRVREPASVLWTFPTRGGNPARPAIGDLDGKGSMVAVLAPGDGWVVCVDLFTGAERWRFSPANPLVESAPFLSDMDGDGVLDVVFGSHDLSLYCITGRGVKR